MNLTEFITKYKTSINKQIISNYRPKYRPTQTEITLPELIREPLGQQVHAIKAAVLSMRHNIGTTIVGEMGTGKTYIAAAASYTAGFQKTLIICPPHLTKKWEREIFETVPDCYVVHLTEIADVKNLKKITDRPLFAITPHSKAKQSYQWKPAFNLKWQHAAIHGLFKNLDGSVMYVPSCPDCGKILRDSHGLPLSIETLEAKPRKCPHCPNHKGYLWQADSSVPFDKRKYSLADYIKKFYPQWFDLLIADEVHEFKAKRSARGATAGTLADSCKRTLALTGTYMGGYSSTMFYLLYRFQPTIRKLFKWENLSLWIKAYGYLKTTMQKSSDTDTTVSRSRRSKRSTGKMLPPKELAGLSPKALFHVIPSTIFLRLNDVSQQLPPYNEQIHFCPMDTEVAEGDKYSQSYAYETLYNTVLSYIAQMLARGDKSMLSQYLQTMLTYPEQCCTRDTVVIDKNRDNTVIAAVSQLNQDKIYPKERELCKLLKENKAKNYKTLIYIEHTKMRDLQPRLKKIIAENTNLKVETLSSSVASVKREEHINKMVANGLDVLITQPQLVQTGLDLTDFPCIIWYETAYSVYVMRQASRRSWRIGQTEPVTVTYMTYAHTMQEQALKLVASKVKSSLALEGEIQDEGLSELGKTGDDFYIELTKQLLNQEAELTHDDEYNVEDFTMHQHELANDAFLVEDIKEWTQEELDEWGRMATLPMLPATSVQTIEIHFDKEPQPEPQPVEEAITINMDDFLEYKPNAEQRKKMRIPENQLSMFGAD